MGVPPARAELTRAGPIVADKNCEKVRSRGGPGTGACWRWAGAGLGTSGDGADDDSDPLHHGEHPVLWRGHGGGHRVHDRADCVQHGAACALDGQDADGRDGHDDAQADALQVCPPPPLASADHVTKRHQGQIGAALVLGGIDETGPHLFTVAPHGSTDKLPYVTMGSGSLAAMAVFESGWSPKMTRAQAIELVTEAVEAGIFNDLGSGSNVDVCVIEEKGTEMMRGYKLPNEKVAKELGYKWRRGTTAVLKERTSSPLS